MLAAGCQSALLAHPRFAPYCFQLATEKMVDSDGQQGDEAAQLATQLDVCEFIVSMRRKYGERCNENT
jgi:hypothetical protein